ncbi:MAG TPA: ABC transporter ATP-binding protein [Steroidobacteraceae bacterium]|jgi:lipopolysaccharide transport system ATP-binding protein|nr:ABC transporter ATP-binding protein [Steroidobacteraceae bacterium]
MAESVTVENLSKRYELGALQQETQLRDQIVHFLQAPFRRRRPKETLWALRDVSFSVQEGEVVGIIGRNGAGKSTLLKVLSKITFPTSGRVRTRGRMASLLEVGTGFHEELTGRENVYLNGSILGMKKREVDARLAAIVEFSGVERFIDTPIKRYSSGMRMRLGFSVAAHLEPDVLIVDEVLAVGDAAFQKKCLTAMQDLRGGGRTVLFVSHNMAAVENLCTRGIWIANGQVRLDGPTHEVIEAYMNSFNSAESTGSELTSVDGRRGSGEIRFTRVEFLSPKREPQTVTRSGKGVVVRLHYHANEPIERPCFGFRMHSDLGTLVTDCSTWLHGIDIPEVPPGDGYVELEIDALNLLPGRYFLTLWVDSVLTKKIFEALENAVHLDVEEAPVYNSSRRIDNRFGLVFFPQRWHLDGISRPARLEVTPAANG